MKTALICGVSGQDGAYLAKLLLEKGYRVIGTSRDALVTPFENLRRLSIANAVVLETMVLTDFRSTLHTLQKCRPDEVYNLSGQSSVALSFDLPVETIESITMGTINLMEAIRFLGTDTKLYNASSSECFGNTRNEAASEETPFRPRSPYGVAKAAAHWAVVNYRNAYGMFASNGILFNHESPLRHERFVTKKIAMAVPKILADRARKLRLENLSIHRDWGWAPDYVDAIWRILQHPAPDDFVIATGSSHSLEQFLEVAFLEAGLNWQDHVEMASQGRPADIESNRGNPLKAAALLNWKATLAMPDVARMMVRAEFERFDIEPR